MTFTLKQKRILITRGEPKATEFAREVRQNDGQAIVTPLIKISYTPKEEHAKLLSFLSEYEWLVFTSANGVHCFSKAMDEYDAWEKWKQCKLAVVGPKTNQALQEFGLEADFMPSVYNAKTMAPEFLEQHTPTGPILLIRGQLSGTVLNEALLKNSIPFDCIEVYATETNQEIKTKLQQDLQEQKIDYLTFTSPSTVDAFMELVNQPKSYVHKKIVCIGTTTEKRALEWGFSSILVPKTFTIEGMMQEMQEDILQEGRD